MVCNSNLSRGSHLYIQRCPVACPHCGEKMTVHSTYSRVIEFSDVSACKCTFRVMSCRICEKTHREIPPWLIPYKRFSADVYCYYYKCYEEDRKAGEPMNASDSYKFFRMKNGFDCLKGELIANGIIDESELDQVNSLQEETELIICRAVNNSFWKQQYFA